MPWINWGIPVRHVRISCSCSSEACTFLHCRRLAGSTRSVMSATTSEYTKPTCKVTNRPDFTEIVPNFDLVSQKYYKVSWSAELSPIPNPGLIFSCFECNIRNKQTNKQRGNGLRLNRSLCP